MWHGKKHNVVDAQVHRRIRAVNHCTASLCSLAARLVAEKDAWLAISLGELSRAETGTLEGEDSIRKLQV